MIEFSIVGDTKTPLLRCILFFSKAKKKQDKKLPKTSFHSAKRESRVITGEKVPFVFVEIITSVLLFRKKSFRHV